MNSMIRMAALAGFAAASTIGATAASAAPLFFQGFESNSDNFYSPTRVASGTDGIASADGSYHAESGHLAGDYTDWGSYNLSNGGTGNAFQSYSTSLDIFLDTNQQGDDIRFDWSSAISHTDGSFLRDFVFNAGLYADADGNGNAGFIISAGNNATRGSSYPKNPDHDPISILNSGWYTFENDFYDNGGVLAVDMLIKDAGGSLVNSWTLSDAGDLISTVGGNRYGWFVNNEFDFLAIDNAQLTATTAKVPEPATIGLLGLGLAGIGFVRRRRRA